MRKKAIYFFLIAFVIGDLAYSFLQYYHTPFDGDVALCVVPDASVVPILEHPLGLEAIMEQEAYLNPNRFFCHWSMYHCLNYLPGCIQHFTNPVDSIYWAGALAKLSVHVLLLMLLAYLVVGKAGIVSREFLLVVFLVTPLFQAHGYRGAMGIIDPAITYTFFYALPVALMILYFMPLILEVFHDLKWEERQWLKVFWWPLALVCSLSSPLNPGIALVFSLVLMLHHFWTNRDKPLLKSIVVLPRSYYFYLLPIVLLSLYSLYVGRYNTNTINEQLPLADLYARLPLGLYYQFFQKLGYPILLLLLLLNALIINSNWNSREAKKLLNSYKWIALFALCYILLLPLGGYRTYRPYILRYDTMMPVTLSLFFLYAATTLFILKHSTIRLRYFYVPVLMTALTIFMIADKPELESNDCERFALEQIAKHPEERLQLDPPCKVLSWEEMEYPQSSELNMKLLRIWNIIE